MDDYNYRKPLPLVNMDNEEFWSGCREHRLRFQQCMDCGYIRWPPALLCPKCHSRNTTWIESSGRGRVYTFAVYRVALHSAFEGDLPYVVADVEVEEGPRLLTNIVGCRPEDIRCDMPVEVTWEDVTDEVSLPKFRPSTKGGTSLTY